MNRDVMRSTYLSNYLFIFPLMQEFLRQSVPFYAQYIFCSFWTLIIGIEIRYTQGHTWEAQVGANSVVESRLRIKFGLQRYQVSFVRNKIWKYEH